MSELKAGFVHRPLAHADADVVMACGMTLPVVETERLWLTALTDHHVDAFSRIQHHPRVAEWFGGLPDPLPSPARQREDTWRVIAMFLGHWALHGHGQWALTAKSDGRLVGRAGLWHPWGWPGVEVGWLVDPDLWAQGYASEAGRAAVDFAFEHVGLDEVISVTVPENTASRRVMEKVGLADTGRTVDLRDHTQVLYRIGRDEWLADVRPVPAWAAGGQEAPGA